MFTLRSNKVKIVGFILLLFFFVILARSLGISVKDIFTTNISLDQLFTDLLISFIRTTLITITAWLFGIVGGYLLHHSGIINDLFLALINFIRHVSPFAWLPFAIIWFGLGETSVFFIMFISLFFPSLIATADHFSNLPHEYIDEGNVLGASTFQMFIHIELPLALPSLFNLFRIIWGLGWTVIIAAEMLGVDSGMGFRLLDFRYLLKYPQMLLYFIMMGFTGIIFDMILKKLITLYNTRGISK